MFICFRRRREIKTAYTTQTYYSQSRYPGYQKRKYTQSVMPAMWISMQTEHWTKKPHEEEAQDQWGL